MFGVHKPVLISIVGPTAVGKTSLSLALARHFETEIIIADSRQMYQDLNIGTAKPSKEELSMAPHHLVDWLSPEEELDAERFRQKAEEIIRDRFRDHDILVVVGGSTLYMQALWLGLNEMPSIPEDIRATLNNEFQTSGLAPLLDELQQVDPLTWNQIDRHNHARVIRALEVYRATGTPISTFRQQEIETNHNWTHLKIALEDDRAALYERIDRRVDLMLEAGLEAEIRELLNDGLDPKAQSLRSIGYREWVAHFQGEYDREEAIRLHKRNSRRYAKRQLTWYRRYEDVQWFQAGETDRVVSWLETQLGAPHGKP